MAQVMEPSKAPDILKPYMDRYKKLAVKFPFLDAMSKSYDKKDILLSDLENPITIDKTDTRDRLAEYTELFTKNPAPNNLTVMMDDLLAIDDPILDSVPVKLAETDAKSQVRIHINPNQWSKVLDSEKLPNLSYYIPESELSLYKENAVKQLHEIYRMYGLFDGRLRGISELNTFSRSIASYDITYQNPNIQASYGNYDNLTLVLEVRNLQINIYHYLYIVLTSIYNIILNISEKPYASLYDRIIANSVKVFMKECLTKPISTISTISTISENIKKALSALLANKFVELENRIVGKYKTNPDATKNNIANIFLRDRGQNVYYYRLFRENIMDLSQFKNDLMGLLGHEKDRLTVPIYYMYDEIIIIK